MVDAVLVHQLPDADAIVSSFSRKLQSELLIVLRHFSLENWMPVQIQGVSSIPAGFWITAPVCQPAPPATLRLGAGAHPATRLPMSDHTLSGMRLYSLLGDAMHDLPPHFIDKLERILRANGVPHPVFPGHSPAAAGAAACRPSACRRKSAGQPAA